MNGIDDGVSRTRNVGMDRSDREGVLVVLHGHASDAPAAAALAEQLDPRGRWHHVAPEGPIPLSGGGRAWFDDEPDSVRSTRDLLGGMVVDLAAQGGMYLFGRSQGAAAGLVTWCSLDLPAPSAVVLSSGFLVEPPDIPIDLGRLRDVPVLLQHGRVDEVVPSFFATDLATALESAGAQVDLRLDDGDHGLSSARLAQARDWLAAH